MKIFYFLFYSYLNIKNFLIIQYFFLKKKKNKFNLLLRLTAFFNT